MVGSDPGEWAYEVVTKWMRGGQRDGGVMYSPRVAWRGGGQMRVGGMAMSPHTPSGPPKPPHSPGGTRFLSGPPGPSHTPTPLLLTLLVTLPASYSTRPPGQSPRQPWRKGQCLVPQGCLNWPSALSASSGPPEPGPCPGAQTWALRWAAELSKVVFGSSDLQVLFSIALGELGAPSTRGHPWFPSPTWPRCLGPSSRHKRYQDL